MFDNISHFLTTILLQLLAIAFAVSLLVTFFFGGDYKRFVKVLAIIIAALWFIIKVVFFLFKLIVIKIPLFMISNLLKIIGVLIGCVIGLVFKKVSIADLRFAAKKYIFTMKQKIIEKYTKRNNNRNWDNLVKTVNNIFK